MDCILLTLVYQVPDTPASILGNTTLLSLVMTADEEIIFKIIAGGDIEGEKSSQAT